MTLIIQNAEWQKAMALEIVCPLWFCFLPDRGVATTRNKQLVSYVTASLEGLVKLFHEIYVLRGVKKILFRKRTVQPSTVGD
jgi:hypothetical protein